LWVACWAAFSSEASVRQVARVVGFVLVWAAMAVIGGGWWVVVSRSGEMDEWLSVSIGCLLVGGGRVLLVFAGRELVLVDGKLLLVLEV
jgi:hypothetical protein